MHQSFSRLTKDEKMSSLEPVFVVDLFPIERQTLLRLLAQLSEEEWQQPTICAGWTVKDIVLHVLGDDIGLLSRKRDAFDPLKSLSENQRLHISKNVLVLYVQRLFLLV